MRPGATIYKNSVFVPAVSLFAPDALDELADGGSASGFSLALPEVTSFRTFRGALDPGEVYVAAPIETNWRLSVDGVQQSRAEALGWAQKFEVDRTGRAELVHRNDSLYWWASLGQLAAWVVLLAFLVLSRRRRA